ncbi:zinc ABC transporter substrate-binding protein [Thiopseudomonas acetoxidans]|uniref:High-affinity zinc uptake system protein ZnuA n=1 Tax=Thiopseudomonas acetoxidans TaxID=3041622 RepID=A0ABT7SR58_9GAMM|nr:zinc ABC transporter substrate-binding protein [Thiopseudomonas sp. CY1220]MDM7858683.1 zinc ABC transporter substrate-binding protein [Thiopseudomonas sp. CY1220]
MARLLATFLLIVCSTAAQAQVNILTSIKPLQLIAQAIQGEQGQAQVLLPPGASPHSFSLRPSDRKRLAEAELFYWIGPDMENFLTALAKQHQQASIAIQSLPNLQLLYYTAEHEDEEDDHEHHDEHDHHHQPGGLDTHLWLSIPNALVIAERMATDLSRLDAQHAPVYQNNLAAFQQRLKTLDNELAQQLAEVQDKNFFVFHEAFNYFEQAYGLQHGGVLAINAEVQPGARHLQQMRKRLEQAGPSCIFTEPPAPPRLAFSLSKDLPIQLQEVDVLGVQAQNYEQLLQGLANQLKQCLSSL